jgi:hypothetical protein
MERGKEEVIMHYSQQHTETQASTNCYWSSQDILYISKLSGHIVPNWDNVEDKVANKIV